MSHRPSLSVVMPVFNVAEYLPETLASIGKQTFTDYELIVVDDGSSDDTAAVVERAAASDPRIRLIRKANGGPGPARMTGVAAARGEFLGFIDGDDEIPRRAWELLVVAVRTTGADFSCGHIIRDRKSWKDRIRRPTTGRLIDRIHATTRTTNVREEPLLIADVFPVNKVYRREFWDRAGLEFPAGRYEDQPTLTKAFIAADSVAVISDVVYKWLIRQNKSSITQGRGDIDDLRDRMRTKRETVAAVIADGDPALIHAIYADILPIDMWEYFEAVPACTDEFWAELVNGVQEFWLDGPVPYEHAVVPAHERLMGWLAAHERREDLARLFPWLWARRKLPYENGVLIHPWFGEPGMPEFRQLVDD